MKVGVVGAGMAGLACAWRLQRAGHEVSVFESLDVPGGRTLTRIVDGVPVDLGAVLLLDNYERTRALAEEVGVASQWFEFVAGPGGIVREGEHTSFTPANAWDVLRYRGLSIPARIQLLRFFMGALRFSGTLDFYDLSVGDDENDALDAWTWSEQKLGREITEYLVDPFIRTFHYHSARLVSARYFDALGALFASRGGFVPHGFRGFMRALPEALAARMQVRVNTAVRSVRRDGSGVAVEHAGGGQLFDRVVVATPGPVAAGLLDSGLAAPQGLLRAVRYSSTAIGVYRVPREVAEDFEGIWVPWVESRLISECCNGGPKGSGDDRDVIFTVGLHHEAARAVWPLGDAAILELMATEWTRLFPAYEGALRPLLLHRWEHALPIYSPGSVARVRDFWREGQGLDGVYLCGDYLNHPWVEGSVRCGEKVAGLIGAP